MDCTTPAGMIACSIRDASAIGLFQILAVLVLPAALGVVTLVVAFASFAVARSSLALSRSIVEDGDRRGIAHEKAELIQRMVRWAAEVWSEDDLNDVQVHIRNSAEKDAILAALRVSDAPGATTMATLIARLGSNPPPTDRSTPQARARRTFIHGAYMQRIASAASIWIDMDTATLALMVDTLTSDLEADAGLADTFITDHSVQHSEEEE